MPLRVVGMMSAMGTHHVAGGRPAQGGKLRVAPSRLPGRMRPNGWSSDVTRDPGCLEGGNSASRARWRTGAANIRNWPESGVSPLSEKGWLPSTITSLMMTDHGADSVFEGAWAASSSPDRAGRRVRSP